MADLSEALQLPPRRPVAVYSPHPLEPARDRSLIYAELFPAETLGQYVERQGLGRRFGLHDRRPVLCTINGYRVPRTMWPHVRPKTGTLIHFHAAVGRGPNGRLLAMIAVAAAAGWVAAPAAAGGLGLGWAGGVGVSILGGLVMNKLFPLPKQPDPAKVELSPSYALAGGSNRTRPYEPFPVIMGKPKVFPDYGTRVYTEFEGDDEFQYQVFDLGYNDVVLSQFKIGATPIENYEGVTIEESGADGKLRLFPGNVDSISGGQLTAAGGWIERTSSANATLLAVEITGSLFKLNDQGEIKDHAVVLEIQYRKAGDAAWIPISLGSDSHPVIIFTTTVWVDDNSTAIVTEEVMNWQLSSPLNPGEVRIISARRVPVRRTFQWRVDEGQYEVRVRRITADDTDSKFSSDILWSQLRTYQPDTGDYTGRKRVGVKIKASGQLQGRIEQFNCIASARTEVWNGAAWVTAETSNPGFWSLAAARGRFVNGRRVWGGGLPDSRIEIESHKAFAAWCALKGLTFDFVFDQSLTVNDMLNMITNCGFGSPTRSSGKLGVVWDAPDQPVVAVFSMANILRDSFRIEYANEGLADEVVVSFRNPALEYQQDSVRALAPGTTAPLRPADLVLQGCQSVEMAKKHANRIAAGNVHRGRRITWRSKWHAFAAARGDVVELSHDLARYDYSGRLVEGSTANSIKLSRKVPLGASQFITIVKPDQTFSTYALQPGVGDSDTVTPAAPLPFDPGADADGHPPYDYTFLFGYAATPGRKVKIESWMPRGHGIFEITAFDESPEFYASEENPAQHVPPRPVFGTAEISGLQLVEEGVRAGNGYLVECTLLWVPGSDYGGAQVFVSLNGGPLEHYGDTASRSFTFTASDGDVVHAEVVVFTSMRKLGTVARATLDQVVDFAGKFPPGDVVDFSLDGNTFRWSLPGDVDLKGFKIRYHFGENRSIADAHELHTGVLTSSPKEFERLPAGLVTFMITAVDTATPPRESVNPAIIVKDLGDPTVENIVEEYDYEAHGFPGMLTGCAVAGGDVLADATSEFYGADGAPFYGEDSAPLYEDDTYETMVYETAPVSFDFKWVGSPVILAHELEGESILVEYRRTGDQLPFYGEDGHDFYGPDADPFYGVEPGWSPWPGAVTYEGGELQFRITIGAGPVRGAVRELSAIIDIPDIVESFPDFVIAPGGSRPVLTKPFGTIKTIKATLEDDGGAAVDVKYVDKSIAPGPLIIARDAALASVAGRADLEIRGHR